MKFNIMEYGPTDPLKGFLYNHRNSNQNPMKTQAKSATKWTWQERWDGEDVTGNGLND